MKSSSFLRLAGVLSMLGGASAVPAATITNELVVHLPFDNDYVNLAPSTVTATPVNTTFGAGQIGTGALQFSSNPTNSVFNYVTLGTPPELNFGGSVDLSVSCWVKFTRWKGDPAFVSNKNWISGNNAGWVLATAGNGGYQWNFTDGTGRRDYDGATAISDGNWHHIAVSYDRDGNAVTFLDGVVVNTQAIGPGVETLDAGLPTNIGQDGTGSYTDNGNVGIDDGMIDDVAIWRRAISAFEAQRIYQFGTNGVRVSDIPDPALPTLASTIPAANATDVPTQTAISAVIVDGALPLNNGTVQLSLNGSPVLFDITKVSGQSTVIHQPAAPLENGSTYTVQLIYGDGVTLLTNTWSFVVVKIAQPRAITGHWDFDNGDLAATLGQALEYRDGPDGTTAAATRFGTTDSFGIANIQGIPAKVMSVAPATTRAIGYLMTHGARPNGSPTATKVNHWTIIMDILIPNSEGQQWFSLMQINDPGNGDDGDLFARFSGGSAGIGIGGNYQGSILAGQWHRIAFAVDTADPVAPTIFKYVDGVNVGNQVLAAGQLNGRHALLPTSLLFADEDGETQPAYVNSIQIRNYKMSDAGLLALGGPTPDGIPLVSGQWDFENANLVATIGTDIATRPDTEFVTLFEGVLLEDGLGQVMRFAYPADPGPELGYIMPHGILPNGGGLRVNQYTLIMDISFPTASTGFRSLLQINTNNATDGDLFVNGGNGIGIANQYQGNLVPDEWHRVVFTVDLTKRELGKYINGANVLTAPVGSNPGTGPYQYLSEGVDGRWSLDSIALLFADEDGELAAGSVNAIQTRPGILNAQQIALLGKASALGIPANIPTQPPLRIVRGDFGDPVISWPASFTGYILESSPTLGPTAQWTEVVEASNNQFEEYRSPNPGFFYRLRKVQ